jgi:hypothetical protein
MKGVGMTDWIKCDFSSAYELTKKGSVVETRRRPGFHWYMVKFDVGDGVLVWADDDGHGERGPLYTDTREWRYKKMEQWTECDQVIAERMLSDKNYEVEAEYNRDRWMRVRLSGINILWAPGNRGNVPVVIGRRWRWRRR